MCIFNWVILQQQQQREKKSLTQRPECGYVQTRRLSLGIFHRYSTGIYIQDLQLMNSISCSVRRGGKSVPTSNKSSSDLLSLRECGL